MNLLFSINRTFIPLLLNCANSILKNGGIDEYAAYVLHSDLETEDMVAIQSAVGKRMKFHFISVPVSLFKGFPTSGRYPQQIYYRLAAPLLLPPELERILYLDVDTIIINSLVELVDIPFDGTYFMACTHVRKALAKINQTRLGMEQEVPYINSGVMLLNLPLFREHLDLAKISAFANKKKRILFLPDQDILTALYGDHVKLLDSLRYNLSDRVLAFHNAESQQEKLDVEWVRKNSVIVHYCGRSKPWKEKYYGSLGIFYQELVEQPNSKLEGNLMQKNDA